MRMRVTARLHTAASKAAKAGRRGEKRRSERRSRVAVAVAVIAHFYTVVPNSVYGVTTVLIVMLVITLITKASHIWGNYCINSPASNNPNN